MSSKNYSEYLFLDLNDKMVNDISKENIFLRVIDLNKANPLIQINDMVFKGSYQYAIGTNMIFEISDVPNRDSVFDKPDTKRLQHLVNQSKVLNLTQIKILPKKVKIPEGHKKFNYNWDCDYKELLNAFENGTLSLSHIISEDQSNNENKIENESHEENIDEPMSLQTVTVENKSDEENYAEQKKNSEVLENIRPAKMLESKYKQLQYLARQPVRRVKLLEPVSCVEKYRKCYEYHNLEKKVLQHHVNFISRDSKYISNTLLPHIYLERCVLYTLIKPSDELVWAPSHEEKQNLFAIDNFDNLALLPRYFVLKKWAEELLKKKQMNIVDCFGRSHFETLEIYEKLLMAMRKRIKEMYTDSKENDEDKG